MCPAKHTMGIMKLHRNLHQCTNRAWKQRKSQSETRPLGHCASNCRAKTHVATRAQHETLRGQQGQATEMFLSLTFEGFASPHASQTREFRKWENLRQNWSQNRFLQHDKRRVRLTSMRWLTASVCAMFEARPGQADSV